MKLHKLLSTFTGILILTSAISCGKSADGSSKAPSDDSYVYTEEPTVDNALTTAADDQDHDFSQFSAYTNWANTYGYSSGLISEMGVKGINQDYFHTPSGTPGYDSGKIVIGDSRCCQLGIYQQRYGRSDFATFAVWGGHYYGDSGLIMTQDHMNEVEQCFRSQIDNCGKCTIYFFATVNDYEFMNNENAENIQAAINTAQQLSEMTYEKNGTVYHPEVVVIGFDGCWTTSDLYGTPQETFNRYVDDYNSDLKKAVLASPSLKSNASRFSTVPLIAGGKASFIDDGLHYDDKTLSDIVCFISS